MLMNVESAKASSPVVESNTFVLKVSRWHRYVNGLVASEISTITRYYDQLIHWKPRPNDLGTLLQVVECPKKSRVLDLMSFPDVSNERTQRTAVLLNGTLNHHFDIQELLQEVKPKLSRSSRIIAVLYNPYLSWLYRLANWLGIRQGEVPSTFITYTDLANITRLSGYEVVRLRRAAYFPWRLLGLGSLINSIFPSIPVIRNLGLVTIAVIRPIIPDAATKPSLSVVIPARNEKGNIENALKRMPDLGTDLEIIFVEGHSSDGTWEEIQRVSQAYSSSPKFKIKIFRQTGKGKSDAVRLGFSQATGDLLTILDADLTMPPELLGRFYSAYTKGLADFVNGTRLVYPMEGEAMRFLNRLGNIFFAKALSTVLDTSLADSLCGTKLVSKADYARIVAWRKDFGDFDPFGDFELLFPAATLGLGIIDIPIRYRARTYGTTNISRFRHGFMLLKMTLIGLFRVKMGRKSSG